MIPHDTDRTVQTSGLGETAVFRIKASGKAFRILIDGLYSNKVRAVIRELWTNAHDSHVAAGRASAPFACSLPSPLSPVFTVRDFGVGMSHEMIMGLYTTIFESSKDTTNDQVGMLGLGSKSPFAYTDTFTVRAFDGVEQRHYVAVIGADGVPQISLVGTAPSTDPCGIEVSFPVNPADFNRFRNEAEDLLIGMNVKPTGLEAVNTPQPLFSGDSWRVFETAADSTVAVRQGCVVYPVDHSLARLCRIPYGHLLVIDVPIGSVEVTGSRESLSLDNRTTEYLRGRLEAVAVQITDHIESALDECPTYVAAARMWNQRFRQFRSVVNWKGAEVKSIISLVQRNPDGSDANIPDKAWALRRARPTKSNGVHVTYVGLDMLDSMRIVVDDGSRVVRKALRLRAAGKDRKDTFVADPVQAANVAALLELSQDQVLPVSALPDPGAPPSARRAKVANDLPSVPFVWGIRSRSSHMFPLIAPHLELKDDDQFFKTVTAVLGAVDQRQVVWMTERRAKQLGLSINDRADSVILRHIDLIRDAIVEQHRRDCDNSAVGAVLGKMPYEMTTAQKRTVLTAVLGNQITVSEQPRLVAEDLMTVARYVGRVGEIRIPDTLRNVMQQVRERFPLLFESRSAVIDYYITNTTTTKEIQ